MLLCAVHALSDGWRQELVAVAAFTVGTAAVVQSSLVESPCWLCADRAYDASEAAARVIAEWNDVGEPPRLLGLDDLGGADVEAEDADLRALASPAQGQGTRVM